MACFHPWTAYRQTNGQVLFTDKKGGDPLTVPCGQCLGCRLERSRQWAMRCVHEASMHEHNVFITLTYDNEHIPPDGGLKKSDFQKFMKRLRKYAAPTKIRYYHCGEYGDNTNRPHYHAILFGWNFDDWVYLFDSNSGCPIYTSPTLEKIWGKGFVTIGHVTFESAGYVARYCMKKLNGPLKNQVNKKTGLKPYERIVNYASKPIEVMPEYSTMSRRPGIGRDWIARYTRDVYPKDFTTIRGMRMRPPTYYDAYLKQMEPDLYDFIKNCRDLAAYTSDENTGERLSAREKVKKAQFKQLKRSL